MGDHVEKKDHKDLHHPRGGAGGKGCIWGHCNSEYDKGHLCSYRWQAHQHAIADGHVYNYPAYKSLCAGNTPGDVFPTAAYQGPKATQPAQYALAVGFGFPFKKKPRPGQWDVTLPRNFSERWTRPYWHNSHHIIPRSVLQDELQEAGKDDARVTTLIAQGLLMATYNLNDKPNMILLPMDRAVAEALGLPRHLLGHEAGPNELEGRQEMDHPDYSRRVRFMVRPVMNQYKRLVMEKLQNAHPDPPDALAKEQLVRVSETIYKAILTAGKFMRGMSLDELKFGGLGGR